VEEAAEATGVNKNDVVKSLVFLSNSGEVIIAILRGDTKLDERKLAATINASGVTKATPNKILQETGYLVGGVPPIGHKKPISTIIDKKVLEKEIVYAGGGSENHLLRISPLDIVRVQNAVVADIKA